MAFPSPCANYNRIFASTNAARRANSAFRVSCMICVSIGRGRHQQMIAEHRRLAELGAQLVELRLDFIRTKVNLLRLLDRKPCPVVVTIRREQDGGRFRGPEELRRTLIRAAIVHGVDYVDLEEDLAAGIPRYGKTKRIISHHDFRKTPDNLEEIHARLAKLDADVVKIATAANHPRDNLRMMRLVKNAKIPTVGMCMGDIGQPTRILAGRFGSPFTYATFHSERQLAPGQLSFEEMKEIYDYDHIRPDSQVFGVIGDPIGHSLSPLVHNAAFREHKLNCTYVPFRVPAEDLNDFLDDARELGIKGLSVTIPHKEKTLGRLTHYDGAVKGIAAANTIVFHGEENHGFNTDYRAAMDSLDLAIAQAAGYQTGLTGRKALVLGAGGAAKAIVYGLLRRGVEVIVTSRTPERSHLLAQQLKCLTVEWERRHTLPVEILVNCTPLGMHPHVDETPYAKTAFKPGGIVFDTVYNPENTLFLKDARERDCFTVSGVDMFIRQAALQYKLFTGQDAPEKVMRESLKRATSAAKF